MLDLLTQRGVTARFPEEAQRRQRLGKFYYRPPAGESWVDVALRLRSLRDSLGLEHAGRRVLLVTHEVPIIIARFLLEELDEQEALRLGREQPLANCSLTIYDSGARGTLELVLDDCDSPPRGGGDAGHGGSDAWVRAPLTWTLRSPRRSWRTGRCPFPRAAARIRWGTVLVIGGSPTPLVRFCWPAVPRGRPPGGSSWRRVASPARAWR